ncbi:MULTISPECIES: MarR family winged helix-turn-helix transcriptional regulator [Brevibacillus]|jgi:DNA-binding MarR family transcriptional regulator|uniref:DNA-binding transcriptional regulator, MarR family n=1 Tax=Brevibacillus centrosporus TaxID=54910 RepID=A0A1I4AZM1_9BACL|nr:MULTISPECIES: MarR family transcriptional regulator [Brevibacillus]MEC2131612.1 MarR family transcriptional regulator [Brevibacillus centrosporus]MED1796196.1 MarR family transcriptional regulator [Brevibacillus nitrificans]MED1952691.1 MarR family transcriptional regulator [Brevibacillus centrosporus]MED4907856.1 MarR family transcriptional regulator [Brevibacillus centrosporus]RNB72102.1 MarR family transcriptional regulator [Brevibacillus centrosporus]
MQQDLTLAMERLQEAVRSTMRVLGPQLSEPIFGLTGPQFYILHQLDQKGKCTVGELAESMAVKPSAITAMIDRLDKHEFVVRDRDENDRRVVHIRLTASGIETLNQVKAHRLEILQHYLSHLSPEELESLIHVFEKMAKVAPPVKSE